MTGRSPTGTLICMSIETCQGIILAANGNASSSYSQLPTSSTLASTGLVILNSALRVVLTMSATFAAGTSIASYALMVRVKNTNLYATIAGGKAAAAAAGLVNANLNVPIGVGSIAQASDAAFIQQLTQTYANPFGAPGGTKVDIITLPGFLVGTLDLLLTTGGTPSATDRITVSVDTF